MNFDLVGGASRVQGDSIWRDGLHFLIGTHPVNVRACQVLDPKSTFCSQSNAQTPATYLGSNLCSHSCGDQLVF
jgi:hypothetical protein